MTDKIKENKGMIIAAVCTVLAALLLAGIFWGSGSDQRKLDGLLDLGQKYLEEMNYEDAVLVFDEAIAIDPKCAQAYLGKAQAQCALGQVEEAVSTLREGIEKVDDSTELEVYLQRILDEQAEKAREEKETEAVGGDTVEMEEQMAPRIPLLNYARIVRNVDTDNPDIQLEVVGGDSPENYTWESNNTECVTVSDTGLVTCHPVVGGATVEVRDKDGRGDSCYVQINDSGDAGESEYLRIEEGEGKKYLMVSVTEDGGRKEMKIISESRPGAYVYHSGDVFIPEQLAYRGDNIPVTSVSDGAYYWCNTMKSITFPASVEIENESGICDNPFYYCTALEEIKVDESNPALQSVDGVLYSKDGKVLYSYPAAKAGSTYTIPAEVETICPGAFVGCKNLEEILVSEGNTEYASIDGVLVDKDRSLLAYPVGRRTSGYAIPKEITQIAENAFYLSVLEEVVCKSVEEISSEAFRQSSKLRKIEGGNVTKSIWMSGMQLKNDGIVEIAGIDEMVHLEYLGMDFSDYEYDNYKTGDLRELGELESLKSLYVTGVYDSAGWTWLADLGELESLIIYSDGIKCSDLSACREMSGLATLEIGGIENLSDISWVENLKALERFEIYADAIEVSDFTKLFSLPNLKYIDIVNYSESDGLVDYFEKMQAENPDITIYYSEW